MTNQPMSKPVPVSGEGRVSEYLNSIFPIFHGSEEENLERLIESHKRLSSEMRQRGEYWKRMGKWKKRLLKVLQVDYRMFPQ
jgi:hypothetical protein